jgi:hypothetical protein
MDSEKIRKLLKYVLQWLAVAIAVKYVPSADISIEHIFIIASVAAAMLAVLDIYCPSVKFTKK